MQSKKMMCLVTTSVALMGGVEASLTRIRGLAPTDEQKQVLTSAQTKVLKDHERALDDQKKEAERVLRGVYMEKNPHDAPPKMLVSIADWFEDKAIGVGRWLEDLDDDLDLDVHDAAIYQAPAPRTLRVAPEAREVAPRPYGFGIGDFIQKGEGCFNRYYLFPVTVWKNNVKKGKSTVSEPVLHRYVRFSLLYEWAWSQHDGWNSQAWTSFPGGLSGRWFGSSNAKRKTAVGDWLAGLENPTELHNFLRDRVQLSTIDFKHNGDTIKNPHNKVWVNMVVDENTGERKLSEIVEDASGKHAAYLFNLSMNIAKLNVKAHGKGPQDVNAPFIVGLQYSEFEKLYNLFAKNKITLPTKMPSKNENGMDQDVIETRHPIFTAILSEMLENRHLLDNEQYKHFLSMLVRHTKEHRQERREFTENLTVVDGSVNHKVENGATYYKFGLSNEITVWLRCKDFDSLKIPFQNQGIDTLPRNKSMFENGTDPAVIQKREERFPMVLNDMFSKLNRFYDNNFDMFYETLMEHAEDNKLFESVRVLHQFCLGQSE